MKRPITTTAVDALADAWASIDGRLLKFRACKRSEKRDRTEGYYQGYIADADEMMDRLKKRGFHIVRLPKARASSQ